MYSPEEVVEKVKDKDISISYFVQGNKNQNSQILWCHPILENTDTYHYSAASVNSLVYLLMIWMLPWHLWKQVIFFCLWEIDPLFKRNVGSATISYMYPFFFLKIFLRQLLAGFIPHFSQMYSFPLHCHHFLSNICLPKNNKEKVSYNVKGCNGCYMRHMW